MKRKIVIKVGTTTITKEDGKINTKKIEELVDVIEKLSINNDIILVSSGAIGCGMNLMKLSKKPKKVVEKQVLASIGQVELMSIYKKEFLKRNRLVGQVLLTMDDFSNRQRYLNARNMTHLMLEKNILPIINENDSIATDEIKVGDNDSLSALSASLIDADLLILVSDIDGLYDKNPKTNEDAKFIKYVEKIDEKILSLAGDSSSEFGTGGMVTKLRAGEIANDNKTDMIILNGDNLYNIIEAVENKNSGTFFKANKKMQSKKYWLKYISREKGKIYVDEGAKNAIINGSSLLAVGMKKVEGNFKSASVVDICYKEEIIGKGICNYPSDDIKKLVGVHTVDIENVLGYKYSDEIIHANNFVKK